MSEKDEIEILLKIGSRFYEGTLRPQQIGKHATMPSPEVQAPVFPGIYAELVTVSDRGSFWEIRPKQFLRKEDFGEIAKVVAQYGGEYVSAGRSSHFNIPKR